MRFWPIKIASTIFWLGTTIFFFYRWHTERSTEPLLFACFFALVWIARVYFLYREWRRPGPAIQQGTEHGTS